MKRIVIEFDDKLHKKTKLRALEMDKSLKQYVTELIEKDLESKEKE